MEHDELPNMAIPLYSLPLMSGEESRESRESRERMWCKREQERHPVASQRLHISYRRFSIFIYQQTHDTYTTVVRLLPPLNTHILPEKRRSKAYHRAQ